MGRKKKEKMGKKQNVGKTKQKIAQKKKNT